MGALQGEGEEEGSVAEARMLLMLPMTAVDEKEEDGNKKEAAGCYQFHVQ